MTLLIVNWHRAFEAGLLTCGGKGYHLAKLYRYGFPVPDGGVVVADVYRQLMLSPTLAGLKHVLTGLRAEDVVEPRVQEQLTCLQRTITAAALSTQVCTGLNHFLRQHELADRAIAIRSSAVSEDGPSASFAGIHRSFLNVRGLDAICSAILNCFASLWTPQAVAYRRRMAFADDTVWCAVVLCAMVTKPGAEEPQSAGVAFSCDPRTGRRDLNVINAARGLGEQVVAGAVDPDHIEMRHVAREYGLPAVVNIPGILDHIKDGETLTVDGDAATVRRLDNPQAEHPPTSAPAELP